MKPNDLIDRTKKYAIRIVKLVRALPQNLEGKIIGGQLLRCGTSVAANYRAACRARSVAEFISKLGIVIEEADESIFWMELIIDLELLRKELLEDLLKEGDEILAIMVSSKNSASHNNK
jgi:four helix bundle protein